MTQRHFADYVDTYEPCPDCNEGTFVDYPDNTIRCRNCGQTKPQPVKKAVAGRKTDG